MPERIDALEKRITILEKRLEDGFQGKEPKIFTCANVKINFSSHFDTAKDDTAELPLET